MTLQTRITSQLEQALALACDADAPPRLSAALHHALIPGGAKVRPQICLSVARACGDDRPELSVAAATAIELMHCASLVHDDMPCFDDAAIRRGKPSVHAAFGEPLALLAGDAMIVMAFETISRAAIEDPLRAAQLTAALARHSGTPSGICAGQAWESEEQIDLRAYHNAKTGALFVAATRMGALAAGADPDPWTELGARIGEAYQVADDLRDVLLDESELGKPAGQDEMNNRPNAVAALGLAGALRHLNDILAGAIASVPACPGEAELCALVRAQAARLVPATLAERTA